ncbi:hypothetical protein KW805_00395 [Candidatus Pacearchaeota archaeon]|nr:hypothetical protein [Candidatus Pacearchaeota archaeon]
MKRRVFMVVGVSFIVMSFIIFLNSFQSVTGYAVFEDIDAAKGYYVGLWFLLGALVVLSIGTQRKN